MKRKIIRIDEEKCNGCGACAAACPKDAIVIKLNDDGFYEYNLDKSKCNNCGITKDTVVLTWVYWVHRLCLVSH